MKNNKLIFLAGFLSFYLLSFGQSKNVQIQILPVMGESPISLTDSTSYTNTTSDITIEVLKFYISKIQFLRNSKVVLEEKNSFHLVDASSQKTMQISIKNEQNIEFDELKFDVGTDSITNVSGALGGDLDPTKGMYWTWQSGYINFKLEGKSSLSHTKNQNFQFHIGGYQHPYASVQTLRFPVSSAGRYTLKIDVEQILEKIDLSKIHQIMSPGAETVLVSNYIAKAFTVTEK